MLLSSVLLLLAIAIEVMATALLPRAEGFTDPGWSAVVIVGYLASIGLLGVVVREIPVSVAYAVWSGVGTALVAAVGVAFLGEGLSWGKAASVGLIVAGVVGLNLGGVH